MPTLHSHPRRSTFQNDPTLESHSGQPEPVHDKSIADTVLIRLAQAGLPSDTVAVSALDGVVTLTGTVHSRTVKYRVEHVASQVPGVADVENLLSVAPRKSPPRDAAP